MTVRHPDRRAASNLKSFEDGLVNARHLIATGITAKWRGDLGIIARCLADASSAPGKRSTLLASRLFLLPGGKRDSPTGPGGAGPGVISTVSYDSAVSACRLRDLLLNAPSRRTRRLRGASSTFRLLGTVIIAAGTPGDSTSCVFRRSDIPERC